VGINRVLSNLRLSPVGVVANIPRRVLYALSYYAPKVPKIIAWGFKSKEDTNYTYALTDDNLLALAHTISAVTCADVPTVRAYIDEAQNDAQLKATVIATLRDSKFRFISDARCEFGRRLGWYALARILKPKVVIETGIDKGHGAILLCAALLRNCADGAEGRYYGTDINPEAGWLLRAPYSEVGTLLIGDSIESLRKFDGTIDLFINDSDHSTVYEYREYQTVAGKLSDCAVIIGDNAHVSPMLARFATETGRQFLFFHEVPEDHWYPGAGLGMAFRKLT
jgi:predicted O-methyltransferase YrrM